MKNKTTALILSILVGGLGVDRFYLGYTGIGVLKLLTGGVFGILWLVDLIRIATGSLLPANGMQYEDAQPVGTNPSTASNAYDDLTKIAELYKAGAITEEEYEKMKADCMARM